MDTNNKAAIWEYLESSSSFNCLEFPSIVYYSYGTLMLNDDQLFLMGQDISTLTLLHMYKITFSTRSYNWAKMISCPTNSNPSWSESIQNSDSSKIYSFLMLESIAYAYFITFNSTDGSLVGSRYKSSISWDLVLGSARNGNNLVLFSLNCKTLNNLFVYDTVSTKITIYAGNLIYFGMQTEPSTNK